MQRWQRCFRLSILLYILTTSSFPTHAQNLRERIRQRILNRLDMKISEKIGDLPVRELQIRHDGRIRRCLVHVPVGHNTGNAPLPLLLAFHGGGGSAEQLLSSCGLIALADREGWLLAAPDGTGPAKHLLHTWNVGFGFGSAMKEKVDDIGFVRALLPELAKRYRADLTRVYATGISNGGILCHFLAAEPELPLAAIAPVVGTAGGRISSGDPWIHPPRPARPVSVLLINGKLDEHIPLEGGRQRKSIGEPVEIWSAVECANFWLAANGIGSAPRCRYDEDRDADFRRWSGGRSGSEVILAVIRHQGHAWPGGEAPGIIADPPSERFDACEVMGEFFRGKKQGME